MPVRLSCTILASAPWNHPAFRLLTVLPAAATVRGFGSQLGCAAFLNLSNVHGNKTSMSRKFAHLANYVAEASGNPSIFGAAALTVVLWLATGPVFAYSDTWQLVMNSWTNVVTFLMVFLIQNSQNRDSSALQAKIDELIRSSAARNTFVGIEQLTPEEIDEIRKYAQPQMSKTKIS
jgi:low affinity Fe/Cu permease